MKVIKEKFGVYENSDVFKYTITNSKNVSISIISYGGIITEINLPNQNNVIENITMNVNTLEEIVASRPYHGAIIGRVSGRISNAEYVDKGEIIKVDANENSNLLHGGYNGLDTKIWDVKIDEQDNQISLILTTISPDGESGFPGDLEVKVKYTLTNMNEFKISYFAATNKRTLFNPTNHTYFNLNGNYNKLIYNHLIKLKSNKYGILDDEDLPTGVLKSVENSPFDMRSYTKLEEVLNGKDTQIISKNGLDHPFVINKKENGPVVTLKEEKSGRVIELTTDMDAIVIYTHNSDFVPFNKENEEVLPKHGGITLETCFLPDAVNKEKFGSIWLEPDEDFYSETQFKFKIER